MDKQYDLKEGGTPIAYRDAIYFRKVQLASRKQFS